MPWGAMSTPIPTARGNAAPERTGEKSSSGQLFLLLSCDFKPVAAWLKSLVCALGLAAPWVKITSLQGSGVVEVCVPL